MQAVEVLLFGFFQAQAIDNKLYLNCGDWVESCTALLEHHDGSIELVHYADRAETLKAQPAAIDARAA